MAMFKGTKIDFKSQLLAQFEMKDLGAERYILGMEIRRDRSRTKLWLSQSKYVKSVLARFSMADWRPLCVPVSRGTNLSVDDCPKSPRMCYLKFDAFVLSIVFISELKMISFLWLYYMWMICCCLGRVRV